MKYNSEHKLWISWKLLFFVNIYSAAAWAFAGYKTGDIVCYVVSFVFLLMGAYALGNDE